MPKVETGRNYYADLAVRPDASTEDVKKAFRKLALKWHPDRNPGKEDEVNSKFQTIQSAHEVLTDPSLRRQYDDARNKTAARPGASGVRGNPWANVAKNYPPPPKRTGATGTTAGAGPGAGAGAQTRPPPGASRYSNFGPSTTRAGKAHPTAKEDPETARRNYEAWENMRSASQKKPYPTKPPPVPNRPTATSTRDSAKASDSEGIPRTASQQQKAQASFGNSARRAGFTPRSPAPGDEPPVTNKNYFTNRTHTNIFTEPSSGAARQSRRASAAVDPLAQFRENIVDGRHSTPYTTLGGEKMSLFEEGAGLGRTKSTRDAAEKSDTEITGKFPFPSQRHRSSSTPRSSSNDGGSEDSTRVNTGLNNGSRRTSTNNRTSRASERYVPKTESTSHPTSSATDKLPTANGANPFAADSAAAQPLGGSPTYAMPPPPPRFPRPKLQSLSVKSRTADTAQRVATMSIPYRDSSSSGAAKPDSSGLTSFEKTLKRSVSHLVDKKPCFHLGSGLNQLVHEHVYSTPGSLRENIKNDTDTSLPHSFSFGADQDTSGQPASQKRFASSSADNINTQFVEGDHPNEWEFKAGNAAATDAPFAPPPKMRSQSGSRLGRRSPTRTARARPTNATRMSPAREGSEDMANPGFSAGEWSEKIGSHHFVPQPAASASASPTRRTNSRKNSKPVKMTMGGSAGLVDDEESSTAEGWQEAPKPPSATDSPMAMDIDTPPLEKSDETPKAAQTNGARNIHVEPTRPEWRAGKINGAAQPQSAHPTIDVEATKIPFTGMSGTQSTSAPTTANPFASGNGGSEDSEEFRTSFTDFKKVEPFADPVATGLQSFADLKTTLPFESKPSDQIPVDKVQSPGPLVFPTAPVAPRLPPTMAISGIRPNHTQWRKYAHDFYNYMEKWEAFHQKVLDHFSARQTEFIKRRQEHGPTWLDTMSTVDGTSLYLTELEQDFDVRKKWAKACDEHQIRIREFVAFRDRAK
ncbi:DnaJ domain-containing protein [Xylariales sp. AK1849]|nr:DnaJ domain-containing protein [Xylariales sp. AK1849]